jgi:hypothetical protein
MINDESSEFRQLYFEIIWRGGNSYSDVIKSGVKASASARILWKQQSTYAEATYAHSSLGLCRQDRNDIYRGEEEESTFYTILKTKSPANKASVTLLKKIFIRV